MTSCTGEYYAYMFSELYHANSMYAFASYHQEMLGDRKRMDAYYRAILGSADLLRGKVVLDVGAGTGILSVMAAMAGAERVYAVEATSVARAARLLAESNGFGDRIRVVQGTVETVELPEQVDVLISECFGHCMLRESTLDSVIVARDRFLKPGGAMVPSRAAVFLAPIRTDGQLQHRAREYAESMESWSDLERCVREACRVELGALRELVAKERLDDIVFTGHCGDVHPRQLLGDGALLKEYDFRTVSLPELQAPLEASFRTCLHADASSIEALCVWFDVFFDHECSRLLLSTAPDADGATHWGQQVLFCYPAVDVGSDDELVGRVRIARQPHQCRLLQMEAEIGSDSSSSRRVFKWKME